MLLLFRAGNDLHMHRVFLPPVQQQTESPDYDWSPDLILPSFEMAIHFHPLVSNPERFYPPRTIYTQVPVKPPNTLSPYLKSTAKIFI